MVADLIDQWRRMTREMTRKDPDYIVWGRSRGGFVRLVVIDLLTWSQPIHEDEAESIAAQLGERLGCVVVEEPQAAARAGRSTPAPTVGPDAPSPTTAGGRTTDSPDAGGRAAGCPTCGQLVCHVRVDPSHAPPGPHLRS